MPSPQEQAEIEALFVEMVTDRQAVGGSLSVLDEHGITTWTTGVTSVVAPVPVGPETVFRIESHTKLVTTALVLQLCDLGRLGLDDEIRDHLPADCAAPAGLTVRHLLSHQSGLADLPPEANDNLHRPAAELTGHILRAPLLFRPGTQHSYSTTAFIVLGAVIEHVTGMPWETAVQYGVLDPLGMTGACTTTERALARHVGIGHRFDEDSATVVPVTDPCPVGLAATAGMFASTTDLVRLAALYTRRGAVDATQPVFSETSRVQATRAQRPIHAAFAPGMSQGLGWQLATWGGRDLLLHQSFGRGTSGSIAMDVDTGVGYAALVNSEAGEHVCIDLSQAMLDRLYGLTVPGHAEPGPSGDRDIAKYAGTYTHDLYHSYRVEPHGTDGLKLLADNVYHLEEPVQAPAPLRQLDDHRFAYHSGFVVFGGFDGGGSPTTLHVRNRLAARV
ncbi:serine hydrolase domain-containing protein [Kutzneria kofuensis]|uniref:CubicO group peptidase (Beta-lactamase class C family) n=1 Tax=Kutzneria kofuensis TaxID=103725 RepID=A0A7W9KPK3_9PSEU|nr:serine hydrolase domain-containing protein [Kutzneria kofuensis]MBB5896366.1 CubicO group peptidase (beta-lactamase class C family) [Kutzneria kofuensis]